MKAKAKLVKESLDEVFHRSSFPLKNSSINKRAQNPSISKRAQIVRWLDSYEIENYTINDDWTIDINGDVNLDQQSLTCFPSFIKFKKVSWNFSCHDSQLTRLEGCPTIVGGDFYCHSNQLTSLEGCPTTVGGSFSCFNNMLTSLEGCPTIVNDNFYCYGNNKKFSEEYVRSLCKVKGDIINN